MSFADASRNVYYTDIPFGRVHSTIPLYMHGQCSVFCIGSTLGFVCGSFLRRRIQGVQVHVPLYLRQYHNGRWIPILYIDKYSVSDSLLYHYLDIGLLFHTRSQGCYRLDAAHDTRHRHCPLESVQDLYCAVSCVVLGESETL